MLAEAAEANLAPATRAARQERERIRQVTLVMQLSAAMACISHCGPESSPLWDKG